MNLLQTYKFNSSDTNIGKLDQIRKVGSVYKKYYNCTIQKTLIEFYKSRGSLPKYLPRIDFSQYPNFSERYKQTCGKQVRSNLTSWRSNVINRCRDTITGSDLSEETKKILYTINLRGLWFQETITFKDGSQAPQELLKLSRKIFHHCRGRYPKLRNTTMSLDHKVACIEKSVRGSEFDYWIRLSTLEKGRPIYLPVRTYAHYEDIKGTLKHQVQVILRPDRIEYGFIKDVPFDPVEHSEKIIGLDTGCVVPLSTSTGHQYGLGLWGRIQRLDAEVSGLGRIRRKNGFYKNSSRMNKIYNRVRSLLKNEMGRIANAFIESERPAEIVLENNHNIVSGDMEGFSPKMRRVIKSSGITRLRDLLVIKAHKRGLKVSKINQAYTSQECPRCHSIDSENRKAQKVFKCIRCNFSRNADYVGSVNIRARRSVPIINIYTSYKKVRGLVEDFYKSGSSPSGGVPIVAPDLTDLSYGSG